MENASLNTLLTFRPNPVSHFYAYPFTPGLSLKEGVAEMYPYEMGRSYNIMS